MLAFNGQILDTTELMLKLQLLVAKGGFVLPAEAK